MYRNTFQRGFISIFYSIGSNPLQLWDTNVKNGHVKRLSDEDCESLVLEIIGRNVETCYIATPASPCTSLGIKLPIFNIIMKNLNKYFSLEIQIKDDKNVLRRFRFSNYQSKTRISSFSTSIPLALKCGWNKLSFDMSQYAQEIYQANFHELINVKIHANCRLRGVFLTDRHYAEDDTPDQFKLCRRTDCHIERPKSSYMSSVKKLINFHDKEIVETVKPSSPETSKVVEVEAKQPLNYEAEKEEIVDPIAVLLEETKIDNELDYKLQKINAENTQDEEPAERESVLTSASYRSKRSRDITILSHSRSVKSILEEIRKSLHEDFDPRSLSENFMETDLTQYTTPKTSRPSKSNESKTESNPDKFFDYTESLIQQLPRSLMDLMVLNEDELFADFDMDIPEPEPFDSQSATYNANDYITLEDNSSRDNSIIPRSKSMKNETKSETSTKNLLDDTEQHAVEDNAEVPENLIAF